MFRPSKSLSMTDSSNWTHTKRTISSMANSRQVRCYLQKGVMLVVLIYDLYPRFFSCMYACMFFSSSLRFLYLMSTSVCNSVVCTTVICLFWIFYVFWLSSWWSWLAVLSYLILLSFSSPRLQVFSFSSLYIWESHVF